jgi:predicted nucleic acid-binding protein
VVVVDSSVWIDFFRAAPTTAVAELDHLLGTGDVRLVVPDLVFYEVLRGFRHESEHRQARLLLDSVGVEDTSGRHMALAAAQHYRGLRAMGVTVRSPIDVLIATFCIESDYTLLHSDRDFDAIAAHRGLRVWTH